MRLSPMRMITATALGTALMLLLGMPAAQAQTATRQAGTDHQATGDAASSGATTAAVGCYGDTCSGKDPQAMGCNVDARTLASYRRVQDSRSAEDWLVELRYSHNCQAQWTRATVYNLSSYFGLDRCTTLGANSCGRLYTILVEAYYDGVRVLPNTAWTPMLSRYRGYARACGTVYDHVAQRRNTLCTAVA